MLIKCPECELQVSDKAYNCPHCGYPMKDNVTEPIKKYITKRKKLPNGFGQITELKKQKLRKPFRAMITVGFKENGRPKCELLKPEAYFKTYNEAYQALMEYNKNPYDVNLEITFIDLYNRWFNEYLKEHPKSERMYSGASLSIFESIYNTNVKKLRVIQLKNIIEGSEAKPNTKKFAKLLLNMTFDYGVENEYLEENIARKFELSFETMTQASTVQREHINFTDDEMKTLWKLSETNDVAKMIIIQCYSGWRPQELTILQISNINLDEWSFTGGLKTVNGINRNIPIHKCIRQYIKYFYDNAIAKKSNFMFFANMSKENMTNTSNKPLSYQAYRKNFIDLLKRNNLNENHRLHDPRVQFVTMCKKCNINEYAIKYIVGHSISDITEKIYTKRTIEWLHEEIDKLPGNI